MKKLTVLALLAALGLFALGCGDAVTKGGKAISSGLSKAGESVIPAGTDAAKADELVARSLDENGKPTVTAFVDPTTGKTVASLGDIKASASGETPPVAPTFARAGGTQSAPNMANTYKKSY